jgi:thiol-disulfide isomerase/thioredoxin
MGQQPGQTWRTAGGLSLSFLVGVAVFAATFAAVSWLRAPRPEPIVPPGQRKPGNVVMPVLPRAARPADAANPAGGGAESWSLADHRGKVVVVNYFATWCAPCMAELPDLLAIARDFTPRGVDLAMVSVDQDGDSADKTRAEVLAAFARQHNPPFPILVPPPESVLSKVQVPIPQTFIYDKQGRLAQELMGQIDPPGLRATLEKLLAE